MLILLTDKPWNWSDSEGNSFESITTTLLTYKASNYARLTCKELNKTLSWFFLFDLLKSLARSMIFGNNGNLLSWRHRCEKPFSFIWPWVVMFLIKYTANGRIPSLSKQFKKRNIVSDLSVSSFKPTKKTYLKYTNCLNWSSASWLSTIRKRFNILDLYRPKGLASASFSVTSILMSAVLTVSCYWLNSDTSNMSKECASFFSLAWQIWLCRGSKPVISHLNDPTLRMRS